MGKLTRTHDGMVAGVCAGIAKYFGWDPTIVRIVYVLASVFTAFAGVLVYALLWIIVPKE
jgi:phage shock protein PspC (stress-responsive transcriptional regulator)